MTFTCQTNKVVNGAHLELSTETLVKFPHLGLISLDLEKTPQIWLDSDNWKMLKKSWNHKLFYDQFVSTYFPFQIDFGCCIFDIVQRGERSKK